MTVNSNSKWYAKNPLLEEIQILRENKVYRMGDLFFGRGIRWREDRETIQTDPRYASTILFDYLSEMGEELDFSLLRRVARSKASELLRSPPTADELVFYLRLGDIMADKRTQKTSRSFRKAKGTYRKVAQKIRIDYTSISKVTLVTAMHFGANEKNGEYFYSDLAKERSLEIAFHVADSFARLGLPVEIQSSENIDEDFCYMCCAQHFVKGFSVIADMAAECLDAEANVCLPPEYHSMTYRAKQIVKRAIGRK